MSWSGIVFVASFLVIVKLARDSVRIWHSPEYKADVRILRDQRRIRKASRRKQ